MTYLAVVTRNAGEARGRLGEVMHEGLGYGGGSPSPPRLFGSWESATQRRGLVVREALDEERYRAGPDSGATDAGGELLDARADNGAEAGADADEESADADTEGAELDREAAGGVAPKFRGDLQPRADARVQSDSPPDADPQSDADALEDLGDEIATLAAHIHAATQRLLALIAEFDRRRGWELDGHRSCAHWLAFRTGIDLGAAREKVRTARALVDLPETSAAMGRGELSFSQVRALTRVATSENEHDLVELARGCTTAQLERIVRGWRLGSRRDEAELEQERHESRTLSVFPDLDGTYVVRGRLTPDVGVLLQRAIEAASDALYREGREYVGERDEVRRRAAAQRRADALGLVAARAMAAGFGGRCAVRGDGEDAEAGESGKAAEAGTTDGAMQAEEMAEEFKEPGAAEEQPEERAAKAAGEPAACSDPEPLAAADGAPPSDSSTHPGGAESPPPPSTVTPASSPVRVLRFDSWPPKVEVEGPAHLHNLPCTCDVPISGTRAERYQVVLHVDERTLRSEDELDFERGSLEGETRSDSASGLGSSEHGRSDLEDGTRVSAETSRRLSCDAGLVRVTHAADGQVLDVGRRTRTISPALRRALEARDRGCRFPGCGLRFTDAHHVRHWADGGGTSLSNCLLLCHFHHRLVHEGAWRVEWWGPGRPVFVDPRGCTHFDGGWEPPELPARPVKTLVEHNRAAGVRPDGSTAGARWKNEADIPDDVYFAAIEGLE